MKENQTKKCVFAGTFDPPTLGHKAMIDDCLKIFDEVTVAVLVNPNKEPCFTLEQRKTMLRLMFDVPQLDIVTFSGTAVELLKETGAQFYVRGVRNGVDLDFENANFYASKKLDPTLVEIYLPCPQELLHVSSSMVRNSLKFGTSIDEYVTKEVKEYISTVWKNQ